MPLHEDLKAAREQCAGDFPIDRLKDFVDLPLSANTPEQLRGIFEEFRIPETLAGVAIANANSYAERLEDLANERMAVPAIITGSPDYLKPRERGSASVEGAFLAVYGLSRARKFIPNRLGAYRQSDMPFGLEMPITPNLELDPSRPIRASHYDGLVRRQFDSDDTSKNSKNDPTTPLRVIQDIARVCLEALTLEELDRFLAEIKTGEKASV